jgi:hypothetical protein
MDREAPNGGYVSPAWRYLATIAAARDFGLGHNEIQAIVRQFPTPRPSEELVDALAEAILAPGWVI